MTELTSLREAIATEAARLLLRRKESNYAAARIRASRWLSRRRVSRDEMPSRAEIEEQLYVLSGLESAEHHAARLREARLVAIEIGERLEPLAPRFAGPIVDGPLVAGAETLVIVDGERDDVVAKLPTELEYVGSELRLRRGRQRITVLLTADVDLPEGDTIDLATLRGLVATDPEMATDIDPADPALAFDILHMLLARLDGIRLDAYTHPEGDALYHALQVFEQGRAERPWDEEFLLACLLHDVGLALEPRHRTEAALEALDGLVTERTLDLIAGLPRATRALAEGAIPRSLRRSEHFDDLLLLARCDRDGREPGAETCTLDEALAYIAGLEDEWADPE